MNKCLNIRGTTLVMEGVNEVESGIKPEVRLAYDVRLRSAARPEEFFETETGYLGVRCARLP